MIAAFCESEPDWTHIKPFYSGFEATLKKYDVTMHFNGQTTIHLSGDSASGETYCLAHHIWVEKGNVC